MSDSKQRVFAAFDHQAPDRTPLFEIFQGFHPIHWNICGRTVATDAVMCWDAMADGIDWMELAEATAQAQFEICKFFGLDMVRLGGPVAGPDYEKPVKTGEKSWTRGGLDYALNDRTMMVEYASPAEALSDSNKVNEESLIAEIEAWDGTVAEPSPDSFAVYLRVRELAERDGLDWVFMGEVGAGAGAAFYPPFQLMWMLTDPDLYRRWIDMSKARGFKITEARLRRGMEVIAIGGDVSCDKGPFISPELYHRYLLPIMQEHVALIHRCGGKAVYTSDGNHWDIKDDFFFNSGVDGYKEVDKAAGMTMERLIDAGVDRQLCIIGNIDARHVLCHGTADEVRREVENCLEMGRRSPGGHILHASHSVHEDVKLENYYTVVNTYRDFFDMGQLPR